MLVYRQRHPGRAVIRSGLIGAGYWGSIVRTKLEATTDLRFVANSRDDYRRLLSDVDWVFICTPTHTHYDIVKNCLAEGINVFCEKPFTGNSQQAGELISLATQMGQRLFVDNTFLYRKEMQQLAGVSFVNARFVWNKGGALTENLYDSLLYHDLYLLITMTKNATWSVSYKNISERRLILSLHDREHAVEFLYDRTKSFKEKRIFLDGRMIDFSHPNNDPLLDIIAAIQSDAIDYSGSMALTVDTLNLLQMIKSC